MGNRKTLRALVALLLVAVMAASLCPVALAYDAGQYYEADPTLTKVSTVQIAEAASRSDAEAVRDKMVALGYDSFVYKADGKYRVMCGKFRSEDDAKAYQTAIVDNTEYKQAYLTNAYLPESAILAFEGGGSAGVSVAAAPQSVIYPGAGSHDLRIFGVFERGQYYEADESQTKVFAVQVAATNDRGGAEAIRDKMLEAGYDSFVYKYDGKYRVMCGKFTKRYDALCYSESVHAKTSMEQAYVTNAYLPASSVSTFEGEFYPHVNISENYCDMQTKWEKPTGPFFRAEDCTGPRVYTIQCSTGTSFQGAEANRDDMISRGYDAFVFKWELLYMNMVGLFATYEDAAAFLTAFQADTGMYGAVITPINSPATP